MAAIFHTFIVSRRNSAECSCGWGGNRTYDKKKSWKAHVRRAEA